MKGSFVNIAGDFNVLDTKEEAWGPLPESNTVQLEVNVPPACTKDLHLSPESFESDQPNEVTVPDPDQHTGRPLLGCI
jgi:hypothetical protein